MLVVILATGSFLHIAHVFQNMIQHSKVMHVYIYKINNVTYCRATTKAKNQQNGLSLYAGF